MQKLSIVVILTAGPVSEFGIFENEVGGPFRKDMPGEGLWRTDLETNETKLLVSFPEFAEKVPDPEFYSDGVYYLFHTKINPQNTRIMQVMRYHKGDDTNSRNPSLFCMNIDGSDLVQCFSRGKAPLPIGRPFQTINS